MVFGLLLCIPATAQIKIGGRSLDTGKLLDAGKNVAAAVTLSDAQIAKLCADAVAQMDKENKVAPDSSAYAKRLKRLTEHVRVDGLNLNFKVYLTQDINAFACGDGSVRVFSGLMDIMEDDELMAVVGHEIGHVVHADVKHAMKNAYLASAARGVVGSTGGAAAKLTDSQLGDVVQAFTSAQFSQKQEYEADEYGMQFCIEQGFDPYGMARSLEKLVALSNGAKASTVQKMFSSHPDSDKRAARMRDKAANMPK